MQTHRVLLVIASLCSFVAVGVVPWSDIAGFGTYEIKRNKFVTVLLHDTERYVGRGGPFKRMPNRANTKMVGGPVSISSGTLEIKYDELRELLESYHRKYSRTA